jgi:hypothetical protein
VKPGGAHVASLPQSPSALRALGSAPPFWYQAQNDCDGGHRGWGAAGTDSRRPTHGEQGARKYARTRAHAHLLHRHATDRDARPVAPLARVLMLVARGEEPAVRGLRHLADIGLQLRAERVQLRDLLRGAGVAVHGLRGRARADTRWEARGSSRDDPSHSSTGGTRS